MISLIMTLRSQASGEILMEKIIPLILSTQSSAIHFNTHGNLGSRLGSIMEVVMMIQVTVIAVDSPSCSGLRLAFMGSVASLLPRIR